MRTSKPDGKREIELGLLTIILHVQRRRRIILVDPSPIIQKPYRVFFPREAKGEGERHEISTHIRGEEIRTEGKLRLRSRSAPDAADVFSDLIRVRTLELGQLCGALDLEVYLFPRSRDDLEEILKKDSALNT